MISRISNTPRQNTSFGQGILIESRFVNTSAARIKGAIAEDVINKANGRKAISAELELDLLSRAREALGGGLLKLNEQLSGFGIKHHTTADEALTVRTKPASNTMHLRTAEEVKGGRIYNTYEMIPTSTDSAEVRGEREALISALNKSRA